MKKIIWFAIFILVAWTCWGELPAPPVNQNLSTQTNQYLKDVFDNQNMPPTVTTNPNGNRYGRYGQIVRYFDGTAYTLYTCVSSPNGKSWDIISDTSCHGVPAGGVASDALVKVSATNYDMAWANLLNIHGLPGKTTPVANDVLLINDSADSYKNKQITISNLSSSLSGKVTLIRNTAYNGNSAGNKSITGVGFAPKTIIFTITNTDAAAAVQTTDWTMVQSDVATGYFEQINSTGHISAKGDESGANNYILHGYVKFVTLDADGFTINFTGAGDGNTVYIDAMCFG